LFKIAKDRKVVFDGETHELYPFSYSVKNSTNIDGEKITFYSIMNFFDGSTYERFWQIEDRRMTVLKFADSRDGLGFVPRIDP